MGNKLVHRQWVCEGGTEMTEDTQRQARMILSQNPSAMDRLLQDTPSRGQWLRRQQAMFERLIIAELRSEAAADAAKTCRVKR